MSSDKNSGILRQQRANGITKPVYQDMNYSWMDLTLDIVIFDDFPGGKSLTVWVLYNMSGLSQWCMSSLRYFQHNLQHRISATCWLLFMRCVSFTFIRLLPTWTPTEIFDSFWAKHFSDCDSIICPIKSKLKFLKVCKILKRTWHFQTDWMLCVLKCNGCSHVVSDAGSTCSCC